MTIVTSIEHRGHALALVAQVGTVGPTGVFASLTASLAQQVLARPTAEVRFPKPGGGTRRILLELGFDC